MSKMLQDFNFELTEEEIGGFGSVHFYLASKPTKRSITFRQQAGSTGSCYATPHNSNVNSHREVFMDSDRSALIVVDMQHYFLEPESPLMELVEHLQPGSVTPYVQRVKDTVVPAIQELLSKFRLLKSPIFFTEFGSHKDDGSDLPLWARKINDLSQTTFARLAYPEFGDSSASIIPELSPEAGETTLKKTTAGTLSSTDLNDYLKELKINTVVVCGVNTDVCVSQTARELADRGYDVLLVEDGCATLSMDAHRSTLEMFGVVFGQVKRSDEIIGGLKSAT